MIDFDAIEFVADGIDVVRGCAGGSILRGAGLEPDVQNDLRSCTVLHGCAFTSRQQRNAGDIMKLQGARRSSGVHALQSCFSRSSSVRLWSAVC